MSVNIEPVTRSETVLWSQCPETAASHNRKQKPSSPFSVPSERDQKSADSPWTHLEDRRERLRGKEGVYLGPSFIKYPPKWPSSASVQTLEERETGSRSPCCCSHPISSPSQSGGRRTGIHPRICGGSWSLNHVLLNSRRRDGRQALVGVPDHRRR